MEKRKFTPIFDKFSVIIGVTEWRKFTALDLRHPVYGVWGSRLHVKNQVMLRGR